jgi:hypothetical protein
MLLNLDRPTRTATLHSEGCAMVPKPFGTQWKLLGKMGRDGGWFTVSSDTEARTLAQTELTGAAFIRCQNC